MPRLDYTTCKDCGGHASRVGPLSHTRLCAACADRRLAENIVGLAEHRGEPLYRWRVGMIRCAGGIMLDDVRLAP